MPSLGISKLALPPQPYRIDKLLNEFEQESACTSENDIRSNRLSKYGDPRYSGGRLYPVPQALALAEQLQSLPTGPDDASLACSVSMRELRKRVVGWSCALYDDTAEHAPTTFTVACRQWEVAAEQLRQFDPRKLVKEFLTDINRAGGLERDGYLIAFLHSELVNQERYRNHFHGVGSASFINILDKLRSSEKYQSPQGERPTIQIRRKPIDNVPYTLSYILKSYWPGMYEGPVGDGSSVARQSHVRRIREPHHSDVLLWMDQWRLEDITLLKNLRVGAGGLGLIPTKLYSHPTTIKPANWSNLSVPSSDRGF